MQCMEQHCLASMFKLLSRLMQAETVRMQLHGEVVPLSINQCNGGDMLTG